MRHPRTLALVLAGGVGGRLEVLTEERAKPAVPFAGVYRLIDFAMSNCVHSGLSDVWIVEQYEAHSLNEHLANGRPWDLDRTYGGLRVLPPYQVRGDDESAGGFAEGNADALYRNLDLIRGFEPDLLLVMSADHVYRLDYRDVIDRHVERDAELTMVTTRVPLEDAGRYGTVTVDDDGRVTNFEYKPDEPRSDLVTAEVFVYDVAVLAETLERLAAADGDGDGDGDGEGGDTRSLRDFGHGLVPELVARGRAFEWRLDGYWRDVGTPESYWRAHMDVLQLDSRSSAPPAGALRLDDARWPLLSYGVQRLPARVHGSARIDGSMVSPGCDVRGEVIRSVLAPGVVVEEGAVVCESIVLHDASIASGARVTRAILDERASVGTNAVVGGGATDSSEAAADVTGDELVLVGTAATIGRDAVVEPGARVAPGERR